MSSDVQKVYYNQKSDKKKLNKKWWSDKNPHETIWPLINHIVQMQSSRHHSNHKFYKMYANESIDNLAASRQLNNLAPYFGQSSRQTFNVVKSCVDTARSKISKQRPRPFFLTENGDYSLQEKAKKLNSFILGLFEQMGNHDGLIKRSLYDIGSECFLDTCITGTGAAKMSIKDKKIVCERFLSDELICDQFEGMYRTPRSMHQIKYIDREVLYATYPEGKYRYIIESADSASTGLESESQDMIPVIESYHLPSGPASKDGRRIVSIQTGTLHNVEWDKPYFPFLVQRWSLRPIGYFGLGLAEELQGIQAEINSILRKIQQGLKNIAIPRVYFHIADVNPKKRMQNRIGEMHYYRDRPPVFNTPQAFNAETYSHLDRLFNKAFELTGISQLSATSKKPSGLDAGVAIREYQDIGSERFSTVHSMYEGFYTPQATYMALDMLETLLEAGHDTVVQAKDGMTLQPIKYSDVRIPLDSFTVRPYPSSLLPTEPSGKLAKVMELVQGGLYDRDEAMELLDFPDLKKSNRIKLAMKHAVTSYIEKIIETGKYQPVEPYQDLQLTKTLAQSYYLEGRTANMPESKLNLLRQILSEVKSREDQMQQAQLQQAQAMQAMQAPVPVQEPNQATAGSVNEMPIQ